MKHIFSILSIIAIVGFNTKVYSQSLELVHDVNPGNGFSSNPQRLISFGDKLFFYAFTYKTGYEPYITDGSDKGTHLLKEIYPGIDHSTNLSNNDLNAIALGDKLIFTAISQDGGEELWITDGTANGTFEIDLNPGDASSRPREFFLWNNKVYFSCYYPDHGTELWVTDGTVNGTTLLKDINEGPKSSGPQHFAEFKEKLVFSAFLDSTGYELWITDGTKNGTRLVSDINPGPESSWPKNLLDLNGKLFFSATGKSVGTELFISDGTNAGTKIFMDIHNGLWSSSATPLAILKDNLLFNAMDSLTGNEIWISDGSEQGTHLLRDVNPGSYSGYDGPGIIFDGAYYFSGLSKGLNGTKLFRTDLDSGVVQVRDLNNKGQPSDGPIFEYRGQVYSWYYYYGRPILFKFNPHIKDIESIYPLPFDVRCEMHYPFVYHQGSIYFTAKYEYFGEELWKLTTPYIANTIKLDQFKSTVFPNPNQGVVNIDLGDLKEVSVALYTISGTMIYHKDKINSSMHQFQLNAEKGVYFIELRSKDVRQCFKLIKH